MDAPKFSAAMIVFGFGEMMLPHFPPPIMAISRTALDIPKRLPNVSAIGATVITATSIKTPAAHRSMVDKASARYTCFSPKTLTMELEMVSAAPVAINTPESTPAANTRSIADERSLIPSIIIPTVSAREKPPSKPPTTAPAIMA